MRSRRRVLVVDDEPDIRTIYEINLELAGYDVVAAHDGADALAKLRTGEVPDVVLLDIMMPRVDGWSVLRNLAEDEAFDDVPVIMVSAKVTETDLDRASAMGAVAFLTKPFTPASLLRLVEEAVPAATVG